LIIWLRHRSFSPRIRVRRVAQKQQCDWKALAKLHNDTFPSSYGEGQDIRKGISHFTAHPDWSEFLFIAEQKPTILGYMFAHYYRPINLGFLRYFAIRADPLPEHHVFLNLLRQLLDCMHRDHPTTRAVLTELDLELPGPSDGHNAAWTHLENFGEYAELSGYDAYVIVGFHYEPPLVDLNTIRAAKDGLPRSHQHILLYIRRSLGPNRSASYEAITKENLIEILDFVIRQVYVSGHDGLRAYKEYQDYAERLFKEYEVEIQSTSGELLLMPALQCRRTEALLLSVNPRT
jgi:hypothetical protein